MLSNVCKRAIGIYAALAFGLGRNDVGSGLAWRFLTCANAPNTRVMPSDFGITRFLDVRLSFHTKESPD